MKRILLIASAILFVQFSRAQTLNRSQRPKPGPIPVIQIADPVVFKLENGITVMVVENHKLPKIYAGYSIDVGPITEGSKAGMIRLLSGMMNEGTELNSKLVFDERIDQMGAEVSAFASGGQASAMTEYFEATFLLMAEAIRRPAFSQASFDKLKSQALTNLKSDEKSASAISARVVRALSFGAKHPYGELTTPQSISQISLNDIKIAYKKYVTPSRGYLTFIGDIKPGLAKAIAIKAFGNWKGEMLKFPVLDKVANPLITEIDVVDLPNAVQSEITVTNLIELPMNSPDYHAVLLANQLLGGGANGKLFRNLREKHAFTYGAYSKTGSGRLQSTFSAFASVRNEKVDSAVFEFLNEIKVMHTNLVTPAELQAAKNLYNGSYALNLENPGIGAGFASSILINGLSKDFYQMFLQKLNAVSSADVLRVSKKYFKSEQNRIIIVGKANAFLPGLKASGFEIKTFDSYANPVNTN
ncbi:M16 family metallopeptidase [Pedobacter lithocola]|uniref:M16 family metallopeptidase n=1 Tax=Pedobacter lithocola TaxID=1908239 RepID=A0ABV8P6F0_9SPHI